MSPWLLAWRSLAHGWRTQLGVLLGVALAGMILVGALVVGDSVRHTLRQMAMQRLGSVEYAVSLPDRYFRDALAMDLEAATARPVAAVMTVVGAARSEDGSRRANDVLVHGVTDTFWSLSPGGEAPAKLQAGEAAISEALAAQLQMQVGDELLLLMDKPSLLPRDAPLASLDDRVVAQRLRVAAVAADEDFGQYSLNQTQAPPRQVFVERAWLQGQLGLEGQANTLLVGSLGPQTVQRDESAALQLELDAAITLTDVGLQLRELPDGRIEVRSPRVFLDPPLADAARERMPESAGVLTYLVNRIEHDGQVTPYSMVAAVDRVPGTDRAIEPGEVVLTDWLAADLGAAVGDAVTLRYYTLGLQRRLIERATQLRVAAIVPVEGPTADPTLMPDFPGISDKEDCRDWDAGIPIDFDAIRDKDEQWWDTHRGTPKAYIALEQGQAIWGNRFGALTALRADADSRSLSQIAEELRDAIDPSVIGLVLRWVSVEAQRAASPPNDFGMLFLSFSVFIVVAALLLTALLYVFSVEQRAEQMGTLLAVGWRTGQVRRLLMREGLLLAGVGSVLGAMLGLSYAWGVLTLLESVWSDAAAGTRFEFHANPLSVWSGMALTVVVAAATMAVAVRRKAAQPIRALLQSKLGGTASRLVSGRWTLLLAAVSAMAALGLLLLPIRGTVGVFFGAGSLMLLAGIAAAGAGLAKLMHIGRAAAPGMVSVTVRSAARQRGRSLAVIALLACGVFMVVAVGVFRRDASQHADERFAGTGGFQLYASSALPVYEDLNDAQVREGLALDPAIIDQSVRITAVRVRAGDEASCLNLNQAVQPRVMGVNVDVMAELGAFVADGSDVWQRLDVDAAGSDATLPAVADESTIRWALKAGIGDVIEITDERGRPLRLKLVGMLPPSILQGNLLISEAAFTRHFPSASGYQVFLIDAPADRVDAVSRELSRQLEDFGLELTPTVQRLAMFFAVEHAYLSIFQALGGLGVLLGSAGLGVVVLRNVLERRGELALLRAVGFTRPMIRRMVMLEHGLLLLTGVTVGMVAAGVAVVPTLAASTRTIGSGAFTFWTVLGILSSGLLWTWLASVAATPPRILGALRDE